MTETTLLERLADPVLLMVIGGMAAYGFRHGGFLAAIAAFQSLAAGLIGLALLDEMTEIVSLAGCPAAWCGCVAFALVFVATIILTRLAVGAAVPEGAMRFSPGLDSAAGAVVGLLAGWLLCGGILVAWSMVPPVQPMMRVDPAALRLDVGPRLLSAFCGFAKSKPDSRSWLLSGERSSLYVPPEPEPADNKADGGTRPPVEPPPAPPLVGEPFGDDNGNGRHDDGEPFLDIDKSRSYTPAMTFVDTDGDGRRDIGLVERYRVGRGRWDRIIVVAPPPPPTPPPPPAAEPADTSAGEAAADSK